MSILSPSSPYDVDNIAWEAKHVCGYTIRQRGEDERNLAGMAQPTRHKMNRNTRKPTRQRVWPHEILLHQMASAFNQRTRRADRTMTIKTPFSFVITAIHNRSGHFSSSTEMKLIRFFYGHLRSHILIRLRPSQSNNIFLRVRQPFVERA